MKLLLSYTVHKLLNSYYYLFYCLFYVSLNEIFSFLSVQTVFFFFLNSLKSGFIELTVRKEKKQNMEFTHFRLGLSLLNC